MKLTQLFSGEARADAPVRGSQPTPAQAEQMSRQIRSLVPGQTISGEIISRNGNEVQIRLSEDMVLNARVDRNLNIEIGKNMTFEVMNNGSALTLSPLCPGRPGAAGSQSPGSALSFAGSCCPPWRPWREPPACRW